MKTEEVPVEEKKISEVENSTVVKTEEVPVENKKFLEGLKKLSEEERKSTVGNIEEDTVDHCDNPLQEV